MTDFNLGGDPIGEAMFEMMDDIARGDHRTITDVFLSPTAQEKPYIDSEREAGLAELDLFASGVIRARGEQPDSSALPTDGALRGEAPLSSPDKEKN